MRAHERCHVRDCTVKFSFPEAPIFRVAGDMRHLSLFLSSLAKRFRSRKLNFMCKAHFLPEDLLLTRTGMCLSKKAVPCLQVPKKTLEMVIRSAISPKHSEVAGALLERSRLVGIRNSQESSSDSECASEENAQNVSVSPTDGSYFPAADSSLPVANSDEATQTFLDNLSSKEGQVDTATEKKPKRLRNDFISRDDEGHFIDYKRIKLTDSDSPQSQGVSETSNGNSRADEDDEEEDDEEEEDDDEESEKKETKEPDNLTRDRPSEPATVMNEVAQDEC